MVDVLSEPALYEFTGGQPPTPTDLERRYQALIDGPGDSDEIWHNWILRRKTDGLAVGFAQSTVVTPAAEIAWLIGTDFQETGYAKEVVETMCNWLATPPIIVLRAMIHPTHDASAAIARNVGLTNTKQLDEDGEENWERWL